MKEEGWGRGGDEGGVRMGIFWEGEGKRGERMGKERRWGIWRRVRAWEEEGEEERTK